MSGSFTNHLCNRVLDFLFGSAAFAVPPTLYVGLSREAANLDGSYLEPSGGGYARVAVINDMISFKKAVGGVKSSAMEVAFPPPTGDWGTVRSIFIADAPAAGNVLAMSDLKEPRSFRAGDSSPWIIEGVLRLVMSDPKDR